MKLLNTILVTMILSTILLSCSPVKNKKPKLMQKSFTYLTTHVMVEVCGPTKSHGIRCLKMDPKKFSASGSVIKHVKDKSYILTAAHFCNINRAQVIEMAVDPAVIGAHFKNIKDVKIHVLIEILDGTGTTRVGEVVQSNDLLDVCVLKTDRIKDVLPLKLASAPPTYGDTLWNLSSPLGIVVPNSVPVLKGVFSGAVRLNGGREVYVITDLPAVFGCSGSPMVNINGDLVGMIYSTNAHFKELSYAVSLSDLRKFLDKVFITKKEKPVTSGTTTLEVIEPDYD
jgi:S1-C subfamily serine protease